MTAELTKPARRTVARVETKRRLGPDAQVDDKALIISPDTPARTDEPAGPPGEPSVLAVSAAPDQDEVTTIMLYGGPPIGEPVVLGGPFVMNTQAEMATAFADFQRGAFGPVPRMLRL